MFHTKICGVRQLADIDAVAAGGGDAVGLNFHPPSPRFVDPKEPHTERLVQRGIDASVLCVGVFVEQSAQEIAQLSRRFGFAAVQLHGDQPVAFVADLKSLIDVPIIRAIKLPVGPLGVATIEKRMEPWLGAGCHLLLDADAGPDHGGSGKCLHWPSIGQWAAQQQTSEWTLAGGLTPENVVTAVEQTGATSVDTASGVESSRGVKSPELIQRFVACRRVA